MIALFISIELIPHLIMRSWEHDQIPPFHYGTHYSTSAFTLNLLLYLIIIICSWEHDQIPLFHYGTHYSTSAFTLN